MNPHTVSALARQRYDDMAGDARGDQILARAERGSGAAPRPSSSDPAQAALVARRRFPVAIRRLHSPAREASGGRF